MATDDDFIVHGICNFAIAIVHESAPTPRHRKTKDERGMLGIKNWRQARGRGPASAGAQITALRRRDDQLQHQAKQRAT